MPHRQARLALIPIAFRDGAILHSRTGGTRAGCPWPSQIVRSASMPFANCARKLSPSAASSSAFFAPSSRLGRGCKRYRFSCYPERSGVGKSASSEPDSPICAAWNRDMARPMFAAQCYGEAGDDKHQEAQGRVRRTAPRRWLLPHCSSPKRRTTPHIDCVRQSL